MRLDRQWHGCFGHSDNSGYGRGGFSCERRLAQQVEVAGEISRTKKQKDKTWMYQV
jgi:hypothetical protein